MIRGGLFNGRQIRSPEPSAISSPSLSWISGRQSGPTQRLFLPNQNIEVSGAIPSRATSPRRCRLRSTSWKTPRPGSRLLAIR
jgi:hypothetical protein